MNSKEKSMLNSSIEYAKSQIFAADARVHGVLVNADIGPVSFGELFGADRPKGNEFVRFEACGVDNRNGYDIVRTVEGVAYAIVSYAAHAKERGLDHLKAHIAANEQWYQERCRAWQ